MAVAAPAAGRGREGRGGDAGRHGTAAHRAQGAAERRRGEPRQATAQRDQARLNLSYTTVVAAQPGRVVQLGAAVGQYAQAGTALTMFVPDDIWVTANFKETQLDRMRPGDAVTLHLDAYPEHAVHGHVASVQPGSGTAFSLLPAENATGNYVKIVQRVPVKIVLDNPPADVAARPGHVGGTERACRSDPVARRAAGARAVSAARNSRHRAPIRG